MVCKFVNVKELKHIKGWIHCNCALDKCIILMRRQKMNSPINGIKMDNGEMWVASIMGVRFDHPKSRVIIGFMAHMRIPLNQCTRIFYVLVPKRKEKKDARYFKPTNTFNLGIWVDQNGIVARLASSPRWYGSYMFTPHASNTTDITRGVECCNGWVKYMNPSINSGTCFLWWCIIRMKLFIEKFS